MSGDKNIGMQCEQCRNQTYLKQIRRIQPVVIKEIIRIIKFFCFISKCYKVSKRAFAWLNRTFLCHSVQKRQKYNTTPNILKDKFCKSKILGKCCQNLCFVVVNENYVVLSNILKTLRGFGVDNDNIHVMLSTKGFQHLPIILLYKT